MQLECESGLTVDSPIETDLSRIEGEEFAILSKDDGTYIQCAEDTESPQEYVLEYQNGSLDEHYQAVDSRISLERVLDAFKKYLNNDDSWLNDFQWERMDLT